MSSKPREPLTGSMIPHTPMTKTTSPSQIKGNNPQQDTQTKKVVAPPKKKITTTQLLNLQSSKRICRNHL